MSLTGLGRHCSLGSADGLGGGGGEGTALPSLAASASDVEGFISGVIVRMAGRLRSLAGGGGGLGMKYVVDICCRSRTLLEMIDADYVLDGVSRL